METWHPPDERPLPTGPESFPASGPNSLARFGARGAARAIDSLIIGVPVLVAGVTPAVLSGDTEASGLPRWASVLWFVLAVVYEASMVTWRGQTVGKIALGIKVARLDDGRPPLWWQAAIRIALPAASAALPFGFAIVVYTGVYSSSSWDRMGRGFHDKAGGTVVVRTH